MSVREDVRATTASEMAGVVVCGLLVFIIWTAMTGCARDRVLTYPDGGQYVYCRGEWWNKPPHGNQMFPMPAGWKPQEPAQ